MSFDLLLCDDEHAPTDDTVRALFGWDELTEEEQRRMGYEPTAALRRACSELIAAYPALEALSDEENEASPWSATPRCERYGIPLHVRWSHAEEMLEFVAELALRLRIVLYDPQDDAVYRPAAE